MVKEEEKDADEESNGRLKLTFYILPRARRRQSYDEAGWNSSRAHLTGPVPTESNLEKGRPTFEGWKTTEQVGNHDEA